MGRILKRVPLDFNAPLNEVWQGYINPHSDLSTECPQCEGSGCSEDYTYLQSLWYSHLGGGFRPEMRGSIPYTPYDEIVRQVIKPKVERDWQFYGTGDAAIFSESLRMCDIWNSSWGHHLNEQDVAALIAAGRLTDFTHKWKPDTGWVPRENFIAPTPREVNDWSLRGLGHDSINCGVVLRAELERLGLPYLCAACNGEGSTWENEEDRKTYEEWEETEPPTGEGFQLWENTSEGSPASPVFDTLRKLARWCATNATTFGKATATEQEWFDMLSEDFVCHKEGNMVFI